MPRPHRRALLALVVPLALAACGSDDQAGSGSGDLPTIVVTTNILGDVVGELVGDAAVVLTIMPVGTDPHEFQPSAREVQQIRDADALIVNGAGFEQGLVDVIDAATADGVPTFEAISAVSTLTLVDGHDHADDDTPASADEDAGDEETGHEESDHGDEDSGDEKARDEDSAVDPHFFTDPSRMIQAGEGISAFLATELESLDDDALSVSSAEYLSALAAADADAESILAAIPPEGRVLVTNHEVLGYFADRYGFDVVGAVVPSGSTADAVSVADLADLAAVIRAAGVPAIFADTSSPDRLADTLASEVGDIEVVELFTESLGEDDSPAATYLEMVATNAQRVADALG